MTINKKEDWQVFWPGEIHIPVKFDWDVIDHDDFYTESDEDIFHIGQSYEDEAAKVLKCKICGGMEFNVGRGDYYTAIKCIKCEWELCVHNG